MTVRTCAYMCAQAGSSGISRDQKHNRRPREGAAEGLYPSLMHVTREGSGAAGVLSGVVAHYRADMRHRH